MKIEISTKAEFITDYEEARKEKEKGNTIWTIVEIDDKESYEQKLVKKNGIGWIVIPNPIEEIVLYKREKWSKK